MLRGYIHEAIDQDFLKYIYKKKLNEIYYPAFMPKLN